MAFLEFIKGRYNSGRRYTALGYRLPINSERSQLKTLR